MAEVLSAWKHVCNGVFYSIRHVFSDRGDFLRQGEKAHTVLIEGKIRGGRIFWKSIAVAGMEAALGSVLAGLTSRPIIGVPTSVGYGVCDGGKTALNSLLACCSPGLSVVNIDNGFGAACTAAKTLSSFGC